MSFDRVREDARMDGVAHTVVSAVGHPRRAEAGEVLLREGGPPDSVLMLLEGRVKVTAATSRGPAAVLGFRGPGDVIGEIGALTGNPRSATVTAVEPVAYLAAAASDVRRELLAHPQLALDLAVLIAGRLRDTDRRAAEHLTSDTTARVAGRLVELADQYGVDEAHGRRLTLPLTQEELAGFAGSSLEAVAKALRTLRQAGWLETGRRELTLRDVDALRRRAAQ